MPASAPDPAPAKDSKFDKAEWQRRLVKSGYFFGAVLLHLILFAMIATLIIFRAPVPPSDTANFTAAQVKIAPPPAPPPPSGGSTPSDADPTFTPSAPAAAPSLLTTASTSTFSVKSVTTKLPNLPPSLTDKAGSNGGAPGGGTGSGAGGGSPFGSPQDSGTPQLVGYLYDLKQTSGRQATPKMDPGAYHKKLKEFVGSGWNPGVLSDFYKAKNALNASAIFIPTLKAELGPKAFGVEKEVQPDMYCIWYKCTAAPTQDGTYHFVGGGDDVIAARVNGKTVFDGCSTDSIWADREKEEKNFEMTNFNPTFPGNKFWIGKAFHVNAGEMVDIDVLIGEQPGGRSNYFLLIQRDEDLDSYAKQSNGSPLLPIFQLDSNVIKPQGEPQSYPPVAPTPVPWTPGKPKDNDMPNM